MKRARQRASPWLVLLAIPVLVTGGMAFAENIDPNNNGSQYAWAENLGWINLQPSGPGGPGVLVSDSALTGWAWSENAGWISLSCTNTSCAAASYGVTNDAAGTLTGYAWSENAGWINFAPTGAGVVIDRCTGIFSGRAWSENAGWITFSSTAANPYQVATLWTNQVGATDLAVEKAGGTNVLLTWTAVSGATPFDVVRGSLSALRSNGNFETATEPCTFDDISATFVTTSANPSAGDGYWFLVRGSTCGGAGTYDDGTQVASRDAGINASPGHCSLFPLSGARR